MEMNNDILTPDLPMASRATVSPVVFVRLAR